MFLKDGLPEPGIVLPTSLYFRRWYQYPAMLKRLYELRDYARHNIDTVVSVGIGGSYLGSKVIFDVQCGAFWTISVRKNETGYPRMYFAGFNVDGDYLAGLIRTFSTKLRQKDQTIR